MEIQELKISVRDLTAGYRDSAEEGVFAYGGKLNVRPPYQREFIYGEKQRAAVIETVIAGFPLSLIYWSVNEDGTYELMDGQQRTVSICQYVAGDFAFDFLYFNNQPEDVRNRILDYRLSVCICKGTPSEKLKWFEKINIASVPLTQQELRNATYHGTWVSDAKRYFSKTGCPAYKIGSAYMSGSPIRQDYLETAIRWMSKNNIDIYMAAHQNDATAVALWNYYQSVISWVKALFPKYRSIMKGVDWGTLYNKYGEGAYDPAVLDERVAVLVLDDDVTAKKGIFPYLFDGDEKHLSIRAFTPAMKLKAYEQQDGICPMCGNHYDFEQMEADHITPWSQGGRTQQDNCQMLCRECNRRKSSR